MVKENKAQKVLAELKAWEDETGRTYFTYEDMLSLPYVTAMGFNQRQMAGILGSLVRHEFLDLASDGENYYIVKDGGILEPYDSNRNKFKNTKTHLIPGFQIVCVDYIFEDQMTEEDVKDILDCAGVPYQIVDIRSPEDNEIQVKAEFK